MRRLVGGLFVLAFILTSALAGNAFAASAPGPITLPGATSAEGLAIGTGSTFYAGDLFKGDIYRGDLQAGTASPFIDAPDGRMALGMKVDVRDGLLFVAGGPTGQAYVYDVRTGRDVAIRQLADPVAGTFVNDVVVTGGIAWFTDSVNPRLYRVPIGADGSIGAPAILDLSGPAARISGAFNLNGIAATADGSTLIVSHTSDSTLYSVDPVTGESAAIAGADLPFVDGILFEAGRLWAVQNSANQVTALRLSPDLRAASVEGVITSDRFETPTAVGRHGSTLAIVNAKFDTGFPPTATSFEVVPVDAR